MKNKNTDLPGWSNFRSVWVDHRVEFQIEGKDFVVIQLNTGKVEIYWVDPADGLEMFQGYADERAFPGLILVSNALAVAALGALAGSL